MRQLMYILHLGNSLSVLPKLAENSIDSIVTDPPYELGFMGKSWDASGIAYSVKMWQEALRVLKPGGHLLAFSGSRTYHRMTCAIEDAGFEVRDQILWIYGSGFPKSLDVSKAIDKAAGAEREVISHRTLNNNTFAISGTGKDQEQFRKFDGNANITAPATEAAKQWQGWGTALKPAHEPICVARKPLAKGFTVAANVLAHGTGALNIDGCRVGNGKAVPASVSRAGSGNSLSRSADMSLRKETGGESGHNPNIGRWPANLIHDGLSEEWARFFYCAKTSKKDRGEENNHPTVKPTDLMRYLCRLVTPPNGTILDPFMGSGSTGKAAIMDGFRFVGIEMDDSYYAIAQRRINNARQGSNSEASCFTATKTHTVLGLP